MAAAAIFLAYFVLPIWILAGFLDYLCHRATRISENAGVPESILHLVQFALVGIPVTLALFFRANALFFLLAAICILLHHLVAYIDLRYANSLRDVEPREQMVHSVLEIMPITAFLLLAVVQWPQFLALLGLGSEPARFHLELNLLPVSYIVAVLAAVLIFDVGPYLEELARCVRARAANKG